MSLPTTTVLDLAHATPAFGSFSTAPITKSSWFDPAQDKMLVAIDPAISQLDLPNTPPSFQDLWDAQDSGLELDGVAYDGEDVNCVCMYGDDSCTLFALSTESRGSDDPLFFVQSPDDCSVMGSAYRDAIRKYDDGDASAMRAAIGDFYAACWNALESLTAASQA